MKRSFLYFFIIISCFHFETIHAQMIGSGRCADARQITDQDKAARVEDNFWKKRIKYRIDLLDKINKPINQFECLHVYDESSKVFTSFNEAFLYKYDLIEALLIGYSNGQINGYLPDTLEKKLKFNEFKSIYRKLDTAKYQIIEKSEVAKASEAPGILEKDEPIDLKDYKSMVKAVGVIEDRFFDRNKSKMVYKPKYLIIYKLDVENVEIPIVAFKYVEVANTILSKYQWTNMHNDAEHRNLKEILELHLFGSYLTGVSCDPIQTIDESEKKRIQMLEFEYNQF